MKVEVPKFCKEDRLDSLSVQGSDSELEIDLRPLRFIEPCGLVALACIAEYGASTGAEVAVTCPQSRDVTNYMSRMSVGQVLSNHCDSRDPFPTVRRSDLRDLLLELCRYETEDGADELTHLLEAQLSESLRPGELQPVVEAVWEVATNAAEHSVTGVGYFAAQVYQPGTHEGRVDFAVGDWGQGIRQSLSGTQYAQASDVLAIEEAVKKGVSRYEDVNRGKGLPFTVFDKAVSRGGQITIRSEAGAVTFLSSQRGRFRRRTQWRPGVLVSGSIPTW